jgi:chorismate synthase
MNSFGQIFRFTTYGESHGEAIGAIVDGVPANLKIDEEFIQKQLDRRKPGQNEFSTPRKEDDKVKILSGVFEGYTTGTPISLIIFNQNQKSRDYSNIQDIFRPSHADFTYYHKYTNRDYRGGGRSSARETAMRVAVGAIAKMILNELDIRIQSGIYQIGDVQASNIDFNYATNSDIYSLDKQKEDKQKELILNAKNSHDSIGGSVKVKISNLPIGLGEPIYYKLDAILASAMMSINASKAVDIGDGIESIKMKGSDFNDEIRDDGFVTNHSGGILGGISNGDDINITIYFKPTPSIFIQQKTITKENINKDCKIKGRHDPCVAIRGSIVCEAMASIVIADMLLLNMSKKMENIKKVYN